MKLKRIRDQFFYAVDAALPRQVARIPYQLALESLSSTLAAHNIEVWARNSFKRGNYVFGVSDLDVTIYCYQNSTLSQSEILRILASHKKIFPFLGEANFYFDKYINVFTNSVNIFELARDPILSFRIPDVSRERKIEQAVFLLKMLFYDHEKLFYFPDLRQKKWEEHFRLLGLSQLDYYDYQTVVGEISDLLGEDISSIVAILAGREVADEQIFSVSLPTAWRFLFPNKHLWFHHAEESLVGVPKTFRQVCLRQIDWEIWGIMSQLPMLSHMHENLIGHMGRLSRAAEFVDPMTDIPKKITSLMEMFRGLKDSHRN